MANNDTIPAARFYAKPAKRPRSPSPKAPEPPQSHTIPVANRSNSQAIHTSGHHFRKEVYVQAAEEMQGKYSMISVDTLLDYLPDKTGMPDPAYDTLKEVAQKTNETEMYEPFILAMTPYIAKEWTFINTSNHFDQTSPAAKYFTGSDIKPDIGLYSSIREGKPFTDSSEAELFGEFKLSPLDDPFPCKESAAARDTRGQIALYINAIQSTQERTRVFSFLIVANMCRLFCHSRAGTEYTKAFDHTKKSFLHQFFWRLSHAKKASFQGHDTTLKRASTRMNPDAAAARKALQLSLDAPLYTVTVADKIFYVSRPFTFAHLFPVGRGTRCYSAYDPVEERVVIIKDTWRDLAYEPEHKVYEKLHSHKVRYIPQVVAAADVNGIFQMTSVGQWTEAKPLSPCP
ncbi:hypothetical protein BT96DRAFT_998245 [Gymnopus androsaceus JB14]|uniref:Fungal-type protein kinase domain-containing protein n=1 Tax=Gymnopus androsaceus JB14 TaxID=1447944 RepID=A0A6A4HAJ7_9AGAR|nr:hypothetical protein BT96DRAFT_998245 [Gymnopus androsaceus JB14]